jgi:hypothetical protein
MAGRYRIRSVPSGANVILSDQNEWRTFESQHEYRLTYERKMFAASEVTVSNDTGKPLTLTVRGTTNKTFQLAPGVTRLEVGPGSYKISVTSWCGGTSRDLTVGPGTIHRLSYTCKSAP